jgi:dTDP-4-dehydrorhamnose 3,5-epimerase
MIFTETEIPGVPVSELERRLDERGFFPRQWCADEFTRARLDPRIAQINTARSVAADTLRSVHYQKAPHAEVKLVRCTRSAVYGDWAYIWTDQTFIGS